MMFTLAAPETINAGGELAQTVADAIAKADQPREAIGTIKEKCLFYGGYKGCLCDGISG